MQAIRRTEFWASSVAIALLVTTLAALPSFGAGAVPSGPTPPLGVHLSYLDDPTTAVLTWYTASASTSRAEWGRSLGPPYSFHTTGTDYSSPGGSFLHRATLTLLTPGARYYYRVGDAAIGGIRLVAASDQSLVRIRRTENIADRDQVGGARDIRIPRGQATP